MKKQLILQFCFILIDYFPACKIKQKRLYKIKNLRIFGAENNVKSIQNLNNNNKSILQMTQTPQVLSPEKSTPQRIDKSQKIQKRKKQKALQSFLQKNSDSTNTLDLISNNKPASDQEQKLEAPQVTSCVVCKIQLGNKSKKCGFCNQPACPEHLRKKRKNKTTHKFTNICDDCEDKYLFGKYMTLELKNQQSLTAEQTIIGAKKNQIQMLIKGRKTKLLMLYHKQNQVLAHKREHQNKSSQQQNQYRIKLEKIMKKQRQLDQLEKHINQLEARLPPSFQEDFQHLQIQNEKVNSQLLKYQRSCNEALKAKSKRQREIYDQYQQWEKKQREKRTKKQQDCCVF